MVLGQGSALGEAFVALQIYCASCPDVVLFLQSAQKMTRPTRLSRSIDIPIWYSQAIACFVANWSDKASNIRAIAQELNIGLDSLVFVDDNPFERTSSASELPMVAVPEVGDDTEAIAGHRRCRLFREPRRHRGGSRANLAIPGESGARSAASLYDGLGPYLQSLEMQLIWRPFRQIGLQRIVQLINKSNQFNLTTRRYTEEDCLAVMGDPLCGQAAAATGRSVR